MNTSNPTTTAAAQPENAAAGRDKWLEKREQVQALLAACKALIDHAQEKYPHFQSERGQRDISQAQAAIAKVEKGSR